jgi:hypothetical protein
MPLPLSKQQAIKCIKWLKTNYMQEFLGAVADTPFSIDTLCGIVCQETANVWFNWINKKTPEEILSLCVFDASGDFPGTQRNAFPRNTAAFKNKYGLELTNQLIHEANISRQARGLSPKEWIYKGYGIFQYDLQHIINDETFFSGKQWHSMHHCLVKVMKELTSKWNIHHDMFKTIRAYNGSGARAQEYANNVTIFISYSKTVNL